MSYTSASHCTNAYDVIARLALTSTATSIASGGGDASGTQMRVEHLAEYLAKQPGFS